ncbi:hypothetical protein [Alloyangia pacifica]|uniref:Lipoprotein n=1 Tax=Alloyangia pacifica TaxID=311180 RepID=A0A1I6VRC2_9RHOB|nr:hypothetical protein [Alloyangia pacifica]SDI11156.1 hypothetical protein SAMN04488245_112157 [Alloyangia pacifica]SFT16280.1 hypothetical protein SAMN04488050_112157 [Alloyangia pacifica]
MIAPRLSLGVFALAALTGCTSAPGTATLVAQGRPIEVIYPMKSGATPGLMERDLVACEMEAAQSVPQRIAPMLPPALPGQSLNPCTEMGYSVSCRAPGGQIFGSERYSAYSYDATASVMAEVEARCILRSGYRLATLPRCPEGVQTRPVASRMYPLSERTCYLPDAVAIYAVTETLR